jgi:thiol-disulfide isomerase/thioredoxin
MAHFWFEGLKMKRAFDDNKRFPARGLGAFHKSFEGVLGSTMLLAAALLMVAGPLRAAGPPIFGFEPVGFDVTLNGKELEGAEVYQAESAGAFLILSEDLAAPVLLRLRDGQVETLNLMKVNHNPNGTVDVLADATLAPQGGFQVNADRTGVVFMVDAQTVEMKEKPPLLGSQQAAGLKSYDPHYERTAEAYAPSDPIVEKLREQSRDVKVSVFFGTWCGACKQMVPRIIAVADRLEGSKITFDFYGLPRGISADPEAGRMGIEAVPTGIVFIDGKEAGRISGNGWRVPELAINNLLVNGQS